MAYGQFTGYEPSEQPGAYTFQLANGAKVPLFGPEAEDLRAKIDASNALMPQPTAQAAPQPDPFAGTALAIDPNDPVYGRGQAASVPDASGGSPPAPQQPAGPQNVGFGLVRTPDGQLAQYRPGSGGVSRQALEQKATQGTAIPVSQQETVRGGFEPNPEFLEGMADVSIAERQNAEQRAARDMAVAQQAAEVARDQQIAAGAQLAEQQRAQLAIETRVNRDQQIKDKAFQDFESARIDPNRMFRGGGGTGRAIAATLGSALGAFGAALAKTPNFAMELINGAIERDIRAQEAEIAVKKQAADNALNDLVQSGLTMEQSKGLLRQLQQNYAAKQAQTIVASNQVPEVMQRYQEWQAEHTKQRLQFEEAYRQQSAGEATKSIASTVAYPQAGSRGGYAPMTPERQIALAKGMKDLRAPDEGARGSAQSEARLDAVEGSVEQIEQSLSAYDPSAVPPTDENVNVLTRAGRAVAGFVAGADARTPFTDESDARMIQDVAAAKQTIKSLHSVLSEQGALSEAENRAADAGLAPSATVGDVRRANAILADRLRAIRAAKGRR